MTAPADAAVDAVIFDLDGTLVDTAPEFITVVQDMRKRHGLAPLEDTTIRQTVTNGAAALVSLALDIPLSDPAFDNHRQTFLRAYQSSIGEASQVYSGLRELLAILKDKNIPWGVATNKLRLYADPLLTSLAFNPPAGSLVTPSDVVNPKPDPESILLSCRNLGARPEKSVYVGDHLRDIEAGRAAGCRTIAAAYGYLEPGENPAAWGADHLVGSSEELCELLVRIIE